MPAVLEAHAAGPQHSSRSISDVSHGEDANHATDRMAFTPPVSSLHLPRLLFLHGGGTNARIFHLQCRTLRSALRSRFRMVFADAPFLTQTPGPDVLSVYSSYGPFRRWLRIRHTDEPLSQKRTVQEIDGAIRDAICRDDALGATGEWVGLVGFSQGCKIAASLLAREQARRERESNWNSNDTMSESSDSSSEDEGSGTRPGNGHPDPRWRFAILFAGRGPLVNLSLDDDVAYDLGLAPANEAGNFLAHMRPERSPQLHSIGALAQAYKGDASEDGMLVLPTLHVHALRDPGLDFHRLMHDEYCPEAEIIEWQGDHCMPIKTTDVANVVEGITRLAKEADSLL